MRLTRLTLTDFRNYAALTWRPAAHIAVITGPNGSGKTNLLEAVSLLVPGRGLRSARLADLPRRNGDGRWGVAAQFGDLAIGTGTPPDGPGERRVFRLDGQPPKSQAAVAERVAAVWLTPQMDRLFGESGSGRRRFLDRLVWALEPGHAREIAAHDTAMAGRNRLLAQGGADPAWLAGLEDSMVRHAVAAAAARRALVARLNAALAAGAAGAFPPARIDLLDPVAGRLDSEPALAVEDWLRTALAGARGRDAAAGSASLGAHRADMALSDAQTGLSAQLASTGQQKALLVGTILGHAALIAEARGTPPMLLLDEPLVHLDSQRRLALLQALARLPATTLMTGTDAAAFSPLQGVAEALQTGGDTLKADPSFPPASPV
jgi:DNA replication and repair protein RecF